MSEQEEFFSPKHKQLLDIATWAKYIAWVVLIAYIIRTSLVPLLSQASYKQMQSSMGTFQSSFDFWDVVREDPLYYLIDIGSDMVITLLRGVVFYVVLKGISLGLNMIVETDINYREQKEYGSEL
jgi:hypothetical protein